jgi:circadian clock protein KaiC
VDVSYLADSVMLFRYFETHGEIRQAVSVFKRRTGGHERTLREMSIDQSGVTIGEPLRKFRAIMTGVPQYDGPTPQLSSARQNGGSDEVPP